MRAFFPSALAAVAIGCFLGHGALAASADAGKTAYMRFGCWQCHGTVGQGGAGPKLAPNPLSEDAMNAFLRSSNRTMPPYRQEVLSDADISDIVAYLASVPKSPEVASIPLLKD